MDITLYLVRHGETEDAHPKRYKGNIDVPLSREGIGQMKRLAQFLVENRSSSANRLKHLNPLGGLNAVYTSDLIRAKKSAEIISQPFGLKPVVVPELRERSFGKWEGMTFDEIRVQYPAEFEAWAGNPLKYSPVGGETTTEVLKRSVNVLNRVLHEHLSAQESFTSGSRPRNVSHRAGYSKDLNNASVAVVSHGGIIRVLLCHFLGIPLENIFRIEQGFGALNLIEFHEGFPVVHHINFIV